MDKRQQLISTAYSLFYRNGINAVGINLILQTSGIAKKTLYSYFPSKEALVIATLDWHRQIFLDWFNARLSSVLQGKHALLEAFSAIDQWINNKVPELGEFHGCYLINVTGEFSDSSHPIHQACQTHLQTIYARIKQQLDLAGIKEKKQDKYAQPISLLLSGALIQAHAFADNKAALHAQKIAGKLLKSLKS